MFEAVGLPLAEFKQVRAHIADVTINDMFLCIVGGALRRYLKSKRELPEASMAAMVPMTLRGAEKGGDVGNQVGFTVMSVCTDIEDPVERLLAIRDGAATSKRVTDAIGKELARDLLEVVPNLISRDDHALRAAAAHRAHRVERARPGRSALHGRCATGELLAHQHRRRRHGAQRHGVQLRRDDVDLRGLVPRDAARPRFLCEMPQGQLRGSQDRRGPDHDGRAPEAGSSPAGPDDEAEAKPRKAAKKKGAARARSRRKAA